MSLRKAISVLLEKIGTATYFWRVDVVRPAVTIGVITGNSAMDQAFAWNPTVTGTKSEDTIITRERGFIIVTLNARWHVVNVYIDGAVVPRPDILVLD